MRHLKLIHCTEAPKMSVKIAFASSDRKVVDQHFGAAESFALYELAEDDARLIEVVQFHDSDTVMDGHEGKLASKIALLDGCAAVYCNAVGGSAIKQLLAASIQPMKVEEGTSIDALLCSLNQIMKTEPPVWMAKAMKNRDSGRFDDMESEGWAE